MAWGSCWISARNSLRRSGLPAWRAVHAESSFWAVKERKRRGVATLAYDEVLVPEQASEDMHTVMFVHGLLGSGRNWRSFAKRLASSALQQSPPNSPGYRMILVDLRNHGNSASIGGFAPPHDIPAAARDLVELIKVNSWGWPEIVISHSMGGKVALEFGEKSASGQYGNAVAPKQLWVLDSVPGKVPACDSQGEVEQVVSTIQSLPNPLPSRRDLDYWSILDSPPEGMEIGIVRASQSDRWAPDVISRLEALSKRNTAEKAGKVSYHVLENAGHWLHVENPEGLSKILLPYLLRIST